jgi:hypothetical protein
MKDKKLSDQIILPENIYKIYTLFEKCVGFVHFLTTNSVEIVVKKNISNMNYYQMDIPFSINLNPKYIIDYIKEINYRNHFSESQIKFTLIKTIDQSHWIEEELYRGHKTIFNVILLNKFHIIFYNGEDNSSTDTSESKYYNAYKILKTTNRYVLRFQIAFNCGDIDQTIDLMQYLKMILNIIKSVNSKFNI